MKAVKVGYYFNLFSENELSGIALERTGGRVQVESVIYSLYEGEAFADSQKVDRLLDRKGDMPIRDYRIKEKEMER